MRTHLVTGVRALTIVLVLVAGAIASTAGQATAGDYEQVVDITFPVLGDNSYVDDYHDDRGGGTRKHKATDIMTEYGQQVHAAVGGEVTWITGLDDDPPSYGYMVTIAGDDGRSYSYIHLGRQDGPASEAYVAGLSKGDRVERGEHIGWAGCSGNASCSAPHLHFEISDDSVTDPYGTHRINPYNSLKDAEDRGDLPDAPEPLPRLAGSDRIRTAIALSEWAFDAADTVVLASSVDFPDGLAAGSLAGSLDAPLLLTRPDALPSHVADEIRRLGAERAVVVGGRAAIRPQVEEDLIEQTDVTPDGIERLEGRDRFATAAAIAEYVIEREDPGAVVLALGHHPVETKAFPDALSASALGAATGVPVLLVEEDALPEAAADVLASRSWDEALYVVGGAAAISDDVRRAAEEAAQRGSERLHGPDRYATSVAVTDERSAITGSSPTTALLATGLNWPDALAAGPASAQRGSAFLLVHPDDLRSSAASHSWLDARELDAGWVVGGTGAVTELVARQAATLIE